MNIWGVGPLLALIGGIGLVAVFVLQHDFGFEVSFSNSFRPIFLIAGLAFGIIGVYFWLSSVFLIRHGYKSHKLITHGVYRYSRNPMYSAFIVFLIPAMAFILNHLLVLFVSFVMFMVFKISIRKEEEYLRKQFGEEYQRYAERVAQLIPFVKL
jgi:protein-S-isoprenylcysteine O-methyltransferase Ste14